MRDCHSTSRPPLPIVTVERFGHLNRASIIDGVSTLLGSGHIVIGLVVLLCSIILPIGKLLGLLVLCGAGNFLRHEHRGLTFRLIELTGRWGMLDVLLVAILVAVLKIGDFVDVSPGPAALAFTTCVLLSLVAAATFQPDMT
jgi:paraquat-inducible protein A